ncbi:hypothetical protein [Cognaticolwellia beringensis]|nr:hypothetical protein [Cognaticolwellia beringensis]
MSRCMDAAEQRCTGCTVCRGAWMQQSDDVQDVRYVAVQWMQQAERR